MNHRLFIVSCAVLHCSRLHLLFPPAFPPLGVTRLDKSTAILTICIHFAISFWCQWNEVFCQSRVFFREELCGSEKTLTSYADDDFPPPPPLPEELPEPLPGAPSGPPSAFQSARFQESDDADVPHYQGYVDPGIQSRSFKLLQSAMDSGEGKSRVKSSVFFWVIRGNVLLLCWALDNIISELAKWRCGWNSWINFVVVYVTEYFILILLLHLSWSSVLCCRYF